MPSHHLRPAAEQFLQDAGARLAARGTESPEALLSAPLRDLVVGSSQALLSRQLDLGDQAVEQGIGRPDFALKDGPLVLGHVELKQLGKGARPGRFTDPHDKRQAERFRRLPNLLYTDGSEFLLLRDGFEVTPDGNPTALVTLPLAAATTPDAVGDATLNALGRLLIEFYAWTPAVPRSLSELAAKIAPLAAVLRDAVRDALATPDSQVAKFTGELRDSIFPDATDDDLADAFAQTCTYSMLLALSGGADELKTADVEEALREAHPLLANIVRHLLHPQAEAEIAWTISLLRRQLEVVDFRALSGTQGRDTWLYFYEDFLSAYDSKLRDKRGVYYTPAEVIAAQVALAEDALRTRLGKEDGFGDESVHSVDPAVGTGSYPIAIVAAATDRAAGFGPGMAAPAATSVIDRIHAFEILVGPYAVSKMRLSELVRDHGGTLPQNGLHVYLADALAPPDADETLFGPMQAILTEEQHRAREFKTEQPVVVCIGNPPYDREQRAAGDEGMRKGAWVRYGHPGRPGERPLLADYTDPVRDAGQGGHLKNLYNDYVYFWRWASWKAFEAHPRHAKEQGGIISFITASSWLTGPGFAGMRAHLRSQCDEIYVIDLGGEGRGARKSENVFDIQTPVAITMCVRVPGGTGTRLASVGYADWSKGTRAEKLARLAAVGGISDVRWQALELPEPSAAIAAEQRGDWARWPAIEQLMPWRISGAQLKRTWPIAPTEAVLQERWAELVHASSERRVALFGLTRDRQLTWQGSVGGSVLESRPPLTDIDADDSQTRSAASAQPSVAAYEYRTLDQQRLLLDIRLGDFVRPILWELHGPAQAYLGTLTRAPIGAGLAASVAGASPPDLHSYRGSFGGANNFPLYRDRDATKPNITPGLLDHLSDLYGRPAGAEDLFCYLVAILATPAYSERYDEHLTQPGPRIPLAVNGEHFFAAAKRGRRLAFLLTRGARFGALGEQLPAGSAQLVTAVPQAPTPATMAYDADSGELLIGSGLVSGVSPEVWSLEASGYKVVQEWIRRRLAPVPGRSGTDLDKIRPIAWDMAMQQDLLRTLWIAEEIVDIHQPAMAELLVQIERGGTLSAGDLPAPAEADRKAPKI